MTTLCYFKFFEFLEYNGCKLDYHQKTFSSVVVIKGVETASIPINKDFDEYDHELKYIVDRFGFDMGEIINKSKKDRKPNEPKITKYEKQFDKITTFHKHCY